MRRRVSFKHYMAIGAILVTAAQQPVAHAEAVNSDKQIVQSVFQSYLAKHKGTRLDTARTPISPTASALIVRFVSKETCREGYCTTAVLLFSEEDQNWHVAFERHVKDLRVVKRTGRAGLYYIEADKSIWEWNGGPSFLPLLSSVGEVFNTLKTKAPARIERAFTDILHSPQWKQRYPFTGNAIYNFSASRISANKDTAVWFAYAYAPGVCGDTGCPSAVFRDSPDGPITMWVGKSDGDGAVSDSSRSGWKDILVTTRKGYKGLSFDGSRYLETYTSYQSSYTRSP